MSDSNETAHILQSATQNQLVWTRDAELKKIRRLVLILQELRQINVTNLELEDRNQVERALKILNVSEYLRLSENDNQYVLGLEDYRTVELSYTERKAIREELILNLRKNLKPIVEFSNKLREELPEIFLDSTTHGESSSSTASSTIEPPTTTIISLEQQRRNNAEKLLEFTHRKCANLKIAAELKVGPHLGNELELLYAQVRLNQTKANLLRSYMISDMVNRSEHTLKAIKEVEGYIDKSLEKYEEHK